MVRISNGWDHSCHRCLQYSRPFKNWTVGNPTSKCPDSEGFWISNGRIWIPTELFTNQPKTFFFQIRKLKRKRSGNSKSVSKISKKSVEGLEVVEKSNENLNVIDKSVQRLEEIKIEPDDQGLEKIKIESDDQQTLHLDVNQNLHQNSGKKEPRKLKLDSNERNLDFNENKSDSNKRNLLPDKIRGSLGQSGVSLE